MHSPSPIVLFWMTIFGNILVLILLKLRFQAALKLERLAVVRIARLCIRQHSEEV